jgi:type IV pilus assembly protein PilC
MPTFTYTAIDVDGVEATGSHKAESLAAARALLLAKGLHPTQVQEKRSILQIEITKEKLGRKELMHFTRQLAVFVRAGIPILEGLEVIGEEASDKVLPRVLEDMRDALRSGQTFSQAAAAHPEAFPNFYVSVLQSAEMTGDLDTVLDQLAEYIDRDLEAKSKILSALLYPAIVGVMAIVTAVVLTVFVLPKFETFFDSLDAELPLPTRMLLALSDFVQQWGVLIGGILLALSIATALAVRTHRGRSRLDAVLLRAPGFGDVLRHAILERFCRVLGSMITAGVPLPDALTVTADVTNNAVYRRKLLVAREAMLRGEGLAGPLAQTGLFPGAARQMFRVGEDTGTLDAQLATAANYYDRELDYKIKKFTGLFEPAVIIFMGVIVGFVAIAMVSAMYGIFNQNTAGL